LCPWAFFCQFNLLENCMGQLIRFLRGRINNLTGATPIWPIPQGKWKCLLLFFFSWHPCYCVNVFIWLFSFVSACLCDCVFVGAPNCGIDIRRKPRKNICRRLLLGPTLLSGLAFVNHFSATVQASILFLTCQFKSMLPIPHICGFN